MSDEIDVKVQAKIAGLASGLSEAQAVVKGAVGDMKSQFTSANSVIDSFKSHWLGIVSLLGGGKLFKDAIDGTIQWTTDVVQLSKRLGITTEEASGLNVALDHLHISTDEYGTIVSKVTRQMRTNEQAFEAVGIRTKESNGEWRNSQAVMADIIAKLNEMRAGTDRNVLAQALMGARIGNITQLLRLNADVLQESAEKAERYHLIVGPDGAAKARAYKDAMADVHLILQSIKITIGNALLPLLLSLGQWFGGEGSRVANFFGSAIKFVAKAALEAWAAVNALVQTAKFLTVLMMTPVGKGWVTTVTAAFHEMGEEVTKVNDQVLDAMSMLNGDTRGITGNQKKASTPAVGETLGGDDLAKGDAKLQKQFDLERAAFALRESQANGDEDKIVSIKREALARARTLFGEHSTQYLAAAKDLEDELNQAQRQGEKIFEDIQKDGREQEKASLQERKQNWETLMSGISSAIETSIMGVIQGTTTMGAVSRNMLRSITLEYINMGVKTLIAHKAAELAKTGATVQGTAQRVALEEWAAVKSVAASALGAIKQIGIYAVQGAAAAFAAIAAIPVVGPFLAPAAAAAAGLAIGAFAGQIASARGGYDIPSGVNPITQLHSGEMVLPASLADRVRGMTAGSGGDVHFHVNAWDTKGVKQFLQKHKDHIVAVVRDGERNFQFDET